ALALEHLLKKLLQAAGRPHTRSTHERRKARHTRSGVAGMSRLSTPAERRASRTASMTVCGAAMQPACPEPLTPSALLAVGRSIRWMSNAGRSGAPGKA